MCGAVGASSHFTYCPPLPPNTHPHPPTHTHTHQWLSPGPPINRQVEQHDLPFILALRAMFVSVLAAQKIHDQKSPKLFPKVRADSARAYPCQQLVGPLPRLQETPLSPQETPIVSLHNPTKRTWPWEVSFIMDLLRWLRALQWADETGTVTFIELPLDFEEFTERTLPAAPQAKFRGHTLPLQERARVLKLAPCTLQRLVKSGTLHPAKVITRSVALVPMGGPALAGLNRRPYFACRSAMISHMEQLACCCESTWTLRMHARMQAQRPCVYRVRRAAEEVEEPHLQRALAGSLNTGLMPSSSLCAKGGGPPHLRVTCSQSFGPAESRKRHVQSQRAAR